MPNLYLITGGAGFIGSHIAATLLQRGDRVRVLDDLSTGKRENLSKGVELIEADITQPAQIAPHFAGVVGVYHVAALPRVQVSIEQPQETNDVNINGTLNVILAASKAGVKRLVYSASSSAYGDQTKMPLTEDMVPRPMSPYGLQKYVGEHYCRLASLFWNLQTVALRYFNVYGPRMAFTGAYTTVIAAFLQQKAKGQPMTITGDGTQTRDFTYVDDVVAANLMAMQSPTIGAGEVMNIGAGDRHSVNEVAEIIGGASTHIAPRIEPHDTLADISRAQKLLGWNPKIDFKTGMKKTIEWFNSL